MAGARVAYSFTKEKLKKLNSILDEVLKEIKPNKGELELMTSYSNDLMERLRRAVPKNVEIVTEGSIAHGTSLRGSSDLDIFMLFPKELDERTMEKKALEIAKSIVYKHKNESYVIKYAEHPYLKLQMRDLGIDADIVPAFKIKDSSEMGSAVDRTQLHTEFVVSHLSNKQKDEVRLLKFILEQHDIYGAEAETEGFSGYLCELLIYHFGSLPRLLQSAANLSVPMVIEPARRRLVQDKNEIEGFVKRFNSRFIVIDPTDPNRNVAANVSEESLARLVLLSRRIVASPKRSNVFGKEYSDTDSRGKVNQIRSRLGVDLYLIAFSTDDISDDILWQQSRRLRKRIQEALSDSGFESVLSVEAIGEGKALVAFFINPARKGAGMVIGPSAFMQKASDNFIKSHRSSFMLHLDGDRLVAVEKPKYANPQELLSRFAAGKEKGMPTHLHIRGARLFINKIPEGLSKMLYAELMSKDLS